MTNYSASTLRSGPRAGILLRGQSLCVERLGDHADSSERRSSRPFVEALPTARVDRRHQIDAARSGDRALSERLIVKDMIGHRSARIEADIARSTTTTQGGAVNRPLFPARFRSYSEIGSHSWVAPGPREVAKCCELSRDVENSFPLFSGGF
jgi:hypothetical protein